MGRRAHKPDPALRRQVEAMAAYGIPETDISRVMHVDPKTLRKHYREELDLGESKANAQVAGFLFSAAKNGNVTAQILAQDPREVARNSNGIEALGLYRKEGPERSVGRGAAEHYLYRWQRGWSGSDQSNRAGAKGVPAWAERRRCSAACPIGLRQR